MTTPHICTPAAKFAEFIEVFCNYKRFKAQFKPLLFFLSLPLSFAPYIIWLTHGYYTAFYCFEIDDYLAANSLNVTDDLGYCIFALILNEAKVAHNGHPCMRHQKPIFICFI